jgi:hypothetical protein
MTGARHDGHALRSPWDPMKPEGRPSESLSPSADRLVATLDGPSKTITVEPIQIPVTSPPPSIDPEPLPEPPPRAPERRREPAN